MEAPRFALDAKRGHPMVTQEIVDRLPELGAQDGMGLDAVVHAKWFHVNNWTWLAVEGQFEPFGDGVEGGWWRMFGVVCGLEIEWGYWDLEELATVEAGFGNLPVERDCYFEPATVREVAEKSHVPGLADWAARWARA